MTSLFNYKRLALATKKPCIELVVVTEEHYQHYS